MSKQKLTDHQRKILSLLVDGKTTQDIADELNIGYETARTHIDRLRTKAGVSNRTALAVWAVREGHV